MAKRHANQIGDLESMFLRIEELVLANSGEDEFEEVFKLLIAKLWDERSGTSEFRTQDNEAATAQAIRSLMRAADKAWPDILAEPHSKLTPEHLAVCVDALSRHRISNDSLEVLDGFFEFMVAKGAKASKGQYFTPRHVVELCVRMLRPKSDETILDPACGSGGFLIHALNYVRQKEGFATPAAQRKFCSTKLWGFDMDSRATRVARALMVLAGDGSTNIIRLNSLLQPSMVGLFGHDDDESVLTIEDVCRSRMRRHKGFDVILTNPPFAGEVREKQILNGYAVTAKKSRVERDVLFVERCVQLLRPGGRLAIVLPHNKFAGSTSANLREWLLKKTRVLAVVGLGRCTFLPHTHQKANVLFLRKNETTSQNNDYPVFFSISERDGKNSKGQFLLRDDAPNEGAAWDRVDHDFDEIAEGFEQFCKREHLIEV